MVATDSNINPETIPTLADRGDPFHSEVKHSEEVAVMIMKI